MPHKYLRSLHPKAGIVLCNPTWCTQGMHGTNKGNPLGQFRTVTEVCTEARAGTGVVTGPMHIQARVPDPQTIDRGVMYGACIVACLAQPGDSIIPDNRAAARCVSKPLSPQSSNYDLHDAAYQLISTKSLQVRWARGHRNPKEVHRLQDYQGRIGNKLADYSPVSNTMHLCRGPGSTSPADILLNNHVMPYPARLWIVKSRPQKLVPLYVVLKF